MTNTPLLFIAGWGTQPDAWRQILSHLKDADCHCLDWAQILERPQAMADVLNKRSNPWTIVGWSLGATLALRAACDFPDRVRQLLLISGTARYCSDVDHPGTDARIVKVMRARIARTQKKVLAEFAELLASPDGGQALVREWLTMAGTYSSAQLRLGIDALAHLDLRAQARSIAVPVTIVHGKKDSVIPVEAAGILESLLPTASVTLLEGHGHALPWTASNELSSLIKAAVS